MNVELLGEDVDELDTVAILSTDELLLLLVVVRGGQEFAEDELRNVHVVLGVLGDVNWLTVVLDLEDAIGVGNANLLDGIGGVLAAKTHDVIVCVDQKLVNQLVEAWVDGDRSMLESSLGAQERGLVCTLNRPDVCVGKTEDVLAVRLLTILGLEGCHGE